MFATLISTILLVNPSVDILLEHHLETPEGRTLFLTEKLTPYVTHADELNREIIALSEQVSQADELNAETLALSAQVTEKMALMKEMLPTLQSALNVSVDFEQIDAIIESEELTDEQQAIADRVAALCLVTDAAE
jgi:hypothetical protein